MSLKSTIEKRRLRKHSGELGDHLIPYFTTYFKDILSKEVDKSHKQINKEAERIAGLFVQNFSSDLNYVKEKFYRELDEISHKTEAEKENILSDCRSILNQLELSTEQKAKTILDKVAMQRGPKGEDGKHGEKGADGSPDKPEDIAKKLNKTKGSVEMSVIKGLLQEIQDLKKQIKVVKKQAVSKKGGGMGNIIEFQFDGDGSTTVFTLPAKPAVSGKAIWVYYQGQALHPTDQFTISGLQISLTFTPQNGTKVEGLIMRTN